MNIRTKVISALRWSAIGRIIGQATTWASTILVIRWLSPEDYALIAMSALVIGFMELLRELGFAAAIIQRDDLDDEQIRSIFGLITLSHSVIFVLIYALAPFIANFFQEDQLASIIRVAAIQFPILTFLVIPQALLVRAMRFKWISMTDAVASITTSIVTLGMAYYGFGVWSLIGGQITTSLVKTTGLLLGQPYGKWPSFQFRKIRSLVSYSGQVFGADLLYYFYTRADTAIIGKILGSVSLGYYTVAYNLATLPMQKISGMLSQVGFAAYARIKNDLAQVKSQFFFSIEANNLAFFPILWGISSVAQDFVSVLLGSKWLSAVIVLQLITLITPLKMTGPLIRPALMGIGRADLSFYNLVTNAACVPLAIGIGSLWGIRGVCHGWIVGFLLAYVLNLRRSLPALHIRFMEFARVMAPAVFMSLMMYAVVALAQWTVLNAFDPFSRLILSILLGAAVYGSLVFLFNRPTLMRVMSLVRG